MAVDSAGELLGTPSAIPESSAHAEANAVAAAVRSGARGSGEVAPIPVDEARDTFGERRRRREADRLTQR